MISHEHLLLLGIIENSVCFTICAFRIAKDFAIGFFSEFQTKASSCEYVSNLGTFDCWVARKVLAGLVVLLEHLEASIAGVTTTMDTGGGTCSHTLEVGFV